MKQTIAFRVDSGRKIGAGHLIRCKTLAEAIRQKGSAVAFITRLSDDSQEGLLRKEGFQLYILPPPKTKHTASNGPMHADFLGCSQVEDAHETLKIIDSIPNVTGIVIDHYGIYKPWDETISRNYKIFKIDDLADRPHICLGLVDQNFYTDMDTRYKRLVPEECTTLVGPQFAILRSQFKDIDINARMSRPISKILLSFGAVDHGGFSLKIARDILRSTTWNVSVIGQTSNIHADKWLALRKTYTDRLKGPIFYDNPLEEMLSADLYIGAGGTITWERFACGLPGIVYSIAQNQVKMALDLASQGYQPYAGPIDSYNWAALEQIIAGIKEVQTRWDISKKMRAIVDGHGTSRIIKAWGL